MSTSDTANRMGSLFNDFLEAAKAIEERPALEARIIEAEVARDRARSEANFANERLASAGDTIVDLRAKVAELEAALAQATFREKAARDSMELVLGALKETMSNAKAAVELVEPPAPEPVPVEPEVTIIDTPFPYEPRPVEQFHSTAGMFDGPQPVNPPSLSGGADAGEPNHPFGGPSAGDATPSLSGTPAAAPPVPAEAPACASLDEPGDPMPYAGQPYWMKSSNITWATWEAGGGAVPHWVDRTGPGFDTIL